MGVAETEIVEQLQQGLCKTTGDIQKALYAGTGCGRCLPVIDDLVEEHGSNKQ